MSEGVPAKKLIPVALLAIGAGFLLFSGGDAKADTNVPPPKPGPGPGPSPSPGPPPSGKKNRKREIDATTPTPIQFAKRYSGDGSRWREVAGLNGLTVYDQPLYSYSNPTLDADGNVIDKGPADSTPYGYTDKATKTKFSPVSGLSPWMLGQVVIIPDDWIG